MTEPCRDQKLPNLPCLPHLPHVGPSFQRPNGISASASQLAYNRDHLQNYSSVPNSREGRVVSDRHLGKPLAGVFHPVRRRTIRFATAALQAQSGEPSTTLVKCRGGGNDGQQG